MHLLAIYFPLAYCPSETIILRFSRMNLYPISGIQTLVTHKVVLIIFYWQHTIREEVRSIRSDVTARLKQALRSHRTQMACLECQLMAQADVDEGFTSPQRVPSRGFFR